MRLAAGQSGVRYLSVQETLEANGVFHSWVPCVLGLEPGSILNGVEM